MRDSPKNLELLVIFSFNKNKIIKHLERRSIFDFNYRLLKNLNVNLFLKIEVFATVATFL